MSKPIYFSLLLFTAITMVFLGARSHEPFSLDNSVHFQNLVACTDTQMAHRCWEKHGKRIISRAKPSLSALAFQFVELCLRQTETEHLHDLHFLLNVQKCFHLSSTIDLQPLYHQTSQRYNDERKLIAIILVVQLFLIIYSTLGFPEGSFLRVQRMVCAAVGALKYSYISFKSSSLSFFTHCTQESILWKFPRKETCNRVTAKNDYPPSGITLAAKITAMRTTTCPATDLDHRDDNEGSNIHSQSVFFSAPVEEKNVNLCEQKPSTFGCACEVSDYEIHVGCRQGSYGTSSGIEFMKKRGAFNSSFGGSQENNPFTTLQNPFSDEFKKQAEQEDVHFEPEITTSDHTERSDSSTVELEKDGKQNFKGIQIDYEDSVLKFNSNGKPSFDISTEAGRAKMKAYVEQKLGRDDTQIFSDKGREYRSLTRVDSRERKMRRIFIANKGWLWVRNSDASTLH